MRTPTGFLQFLWFRWWARSLQFRFAVWLAFAPARAAWAPDGTPRRTTRATNNPARPINATTPRPRSPVPVPVAILSSEAFEVSIARAATSVSSQRNKAFSRLRGFFPYRMAWTPSPHSLDSVPHGLDSVPRVSRLYKRTEAVSRD